MKLRYIAAGIAVWMIAALVIGKALIADGDADQAAREQSGAQRAATQPDENASTQPSATTSPPGSVAPGGPAGTSAGGVYTPEEIEQIYQRGGDEEANRRLPLDPYDHDPETQRRTEEFVKAYPAIQRLPRHATQFSADITDPAGGKAHGIEVTYTNSRAEAKRAFERWLRSIGDRPGNYHIVYRRR